MTQSHTPTPFHAEQIMEDDVFILPDALNFDPNVRSRPIAKMIGEDKEANAAFIVKAVNNHEALFSALKSAKWMLERDFIDPQKLEIIRKCDAAIEAVTGDA